jgi:putative transposase
MRRSRFSDDRINGILKERAARVPVADIVCKLGISDAALYDWRSRFGGMDVWDAKRLNALE